MLNPTPRWTHVYTGGDNQIVQESVRRYSSNASLEPDQPCLPNSKGDSGCGRPLSP